MTTDRFRVVTYNIHKCRGLDRRVSPERIVAVLRETRADVIALQEVVCVEGGARAHNQARFIAEELGMDYRLGENRRHDGGAYGNATLSCLPIVRTQNHDITWRGREPRGCLQTDVELADGRIVHIFNAHLGTAFIERRNQARKLLGEEILDSETLAGARVLLGDFNEWTHGLASRLFAAHFKSADVRYHLRRAKTYPGILPFLHLDHVYYDPTLTLERLALHRNRRSLIASDHLPLVADFSY